MFNFFLKISLQYADKQDYYVNPVISGTSDNNAYKTPNIIKSCSDIYSKNNEERKKDYVMDFLLICFLYMPSLYYIILSFTFSTPFPYM